MTTQLPGAMLVAVLLASVRAAAWLVVCPPFNNRAIPGQVKALLAVALALPVAPGLTAHLPDLSTPGLLTALVEQVVVGAALGFLTALAFAAVQAAGDLIDLFGGFQLAFAFDPLSMSGNSVFGRFYGLLAGALLFATDAHLLVLRGFTSSYHSLPVDRTLSLATLGAALTTGFGQLFVAALQMAGPLVAVLFLADVGLGLLSRAAPALNAFSLAFPAKILLTLTLAGLAMLLLPGSVRGLAEQAVTGLLGVTR